MATFAALVVLLTAGSLTAATIAVVKASHQPTPTLCWNPLSKAQP